MGEGFWSIEKEPKHVHPSVVSSLADSHKSGGEEKVVKKGRRGRKWETLNSPGGVFCVMKRCSYTCSLLTLHNLIKHLILYICGNEA